MSKILEASCVANTVTVDDLPVLTAQILSEGVGESEGVMLMQGDKQYYIAKISPDLKTTIEKLSDLIVKLVPIITAIGSGMTGPTTAPPPTLAVDLAELTAINVELTTLKSMLK